MLLFDVVTADVFTVVVVVCVDDVDEVLVIADVSLPDDFFVLVVIVVGVVVMVISDVVGAGMASIQTDFEIFSAVWISDLSLLKGKPSA